MRSKVHPQYKTKYRVGNWSAYEQALVQRGDVTLWLSADATDAWRPSPSGRPGAPKTFSDCAIETALTLRLLFRVPLRQAEGFLRSVLSLMGVDLAAPDHTTLSRRSQSLAVEFRRIHRVTSPRWTSARSYAGQFPTRYFVLYMGCTLDFTSRSCPFGRHDGQGRDEHLFPRTNATHGRIQAFGIEGTGGYGVGLARAVRRAGHRVVEVNRADRRLRRVAGKSDRIDAEAAARSVLAGQATATPKTAVTARPTPPSIGRSSSACGTTSQRSTTLCDVRPTAAPNVRSSGASNVSSRERSTSAS